MAVTSLVRKQLRPIKQLYTLAQLKLAELPYRMKSPPAGSADWLIKTEVKYGGITKNVARQKVSSLDSRDASQLAFGGMTGGDRMLHNGYASIYAKYLAPFLNSDGLGVAEFGILKGTGLAIWCDLFPNARVIGLDIDLDHFENNRAKLIRCGALMTNSPELHTYDQLADDSTRVAEILGGQKLDIVIDDGLHSCESIIKTWRAIVPHLSPRFVFFVEDHARLPEKCASEFEGYDCRSFGLMTVISAGLQVDRD